MKRHSNDSRRVKQRQIARQAQRKEAVDFFNVLTGPQFLETTEAHLPEHRERLYSPTVTLSMFIKQALDADGSCQKVVNAWAAQRAAEGLSDCSVRTGSYCKARYRLPIEMVRGLARTTGQQLSVRAPAEWRWRKRIVKLMDGTTVTMPDTEENQADYPQPNTQAAGVGFPIARIVGVICLATGAVLDAAMGAYAGKGTGEVGLFRRLIEAFSAGDIALADALFCNYFLIAALKARGVDVLFEQHGARITDFRRGESLGRHDHRVHWCVFHSCRAGVSRHVGPGFHTLPVQDFMACRSKPTRGGALCRKVGSRVKRRAQRGEGSQVLTPAQPARVSDFSFASHF